MSRTDQEKSPARPDSREPGWSGAAVEIFSTGGAEAAAKELDAPFLGSIPLNIKIRLNGDAGAPMSNFTKTEPSISEALERIVKNFVAQVEEMAKKSTPLPQLKISG